MASRPKRKRTANKRLDPPATATQPSASASSEDMTTLLQQCMSRIMPTIEDTFKTCIADYFSNRNPTATPQPQPLEHPAAIQPPTLLHEITGGSPVPNSAAGKQDCLVDSDPPQTLSALSLTLGVDQKTRAKIHSDEYVKFTSLLKSNDPDNEESYKTVEKDGQLFFQKTSDKPQITSVYKWIECFHVFVAIYAEKHPNEVPNLMAYGQIVQKISKTSGDKAAIAYDESFRRWRQLDPAACPWQSKNIELYQEAMAQGLEFKLKTKNQPFRATSTQQKHRYCFSYNNNGFCKAKGCPHPHVCQICAARHHKRQCPKFRQNNKPLSQAPKQSPNSTSDASVPIRKL